MEFNAAFQWQCHPDAESLVENFLAEACAQNSFIATLSKELKQQTSTRLLDWLDHLVLGNSNGLQQELQASGYITDTPAQASQIFYHPGAQLPRIVVQEAEQSLLGIAVSVDSIPDFLMVRGISRPIEGSPLSSYRRCCVSTENNIALWAIERRGTLMMEPTNYDPKFLAKYFEAEEKWLSRPRPLENEDEALSAAFKLAQEMVSLLGVGMAACLVLECERKYWQARNMAGQLQKNRQDRLGMGWANHDHHTFRSSRHHFSQLVRLFEILGFHCRERFYAGQEAGWGAQVMENAQCRLVLFLDVDLAPNELAVDFAHQPLPELPTLGTVGLWCALHGDSILRAGMHHLEAQFMFEDLTRDLAGLGVGMMPPFSSFPYLKQAFTQGEVWPVEQARIDSLVQGGKITREQAAKFAADGAIGSHLENLQRREGYKGFNQQNVSFIIKETDPRNWKHA